MYDYREAMKADVKNYIKFNVDFSDYANIDEAEENLYEDLWVEDSVTGNASGAVILSAEPRQRRM